jgi:crossover junction endodeoxyribonuclease RusA
MNNSLVFNVYGIPGPQGSKKYLGRGVMIESSNKVKPWRQDVRFTALAAKTVDWDTSVPMALSVVFLFQRPKSHYGKKGLRSTAPVHCTSASLGDIDKLLRSTNDALTGILFDDDRQVVSVNAQKRYCVGAEQPGALIVLTALTLNAS